MLVPYLVHILIIILDQELNQKWNAVYRGMSVLVFLIMLVINQVLLVSFTHIAVEGWQDVGWTVARKSTFIEETGQMAENPLPVISTLIIALLFSMIYSHGPFIAGAMYIRLKDTLKIVYAIPLFILLSVMFTLAALIIGFPITLFFALTPP